LTRIKRHNCVRILSLLRGRYAPAEGRLAAAISTISARRRRTREGADRNSEDNDRIETGSLRKSGEKSPAKSWRTAQNGSVAEYCRGRAENSNNSAAEEACRSQFVAACHPEAAETLREPVRLTRWSIDKIPSVPDCGPQSSPQVVQEFQPSSIPDLD
jgi:hypothetical protein